MTELTRCERCPDEWLQEVQEEIKLGCLSADNHAFLHGQPTSVAGSSVSGCNACGCVGCTGISECSICATEREARKLVALSSSDARFKDPRFQNARAIFTNNDVKFDVNKRRARTFAYEHRESITWIKANDKPNQATLAEHPNIISQKMEWLQNHDRHCGNLYGMFPLIKGMPVALTDHVDRKKERPLLRGRIGTLDSWILHPEEQSVFQNGVRILDNMPQAVIIHFPRETWKLPSLPRPGLYPLKPTTKTWYLDKSRKTPLLCISRTQFPIAPAFAITAHTSQGQTLDSAIIDLCVPDEASAVTAYVAMTRVRSKESLLIYRPFPLERFAHGHTDGPDLLLRKLRGEVLDWRQIEEAHAPSKVCCKCLEIRVREDFSAEQWKRPMTMTCKPCVNKFREEGLLECAMCNEWYSTKHFNVRELSIAKKQCAHCRELLANYRKSSAETCQYCGRCLTPSEFARCDGDKNCNTCDHCKSKNQYTCCVCDLHLTAHDFSKNQLGRKRKTCKTCGREDSTTRTFTAWTCVMCEKTLDRTAFSTKQQEQQPPRTCLACNEIADATRTSDIRREAWQCSLCREFLTRHDFSNKEASAKCRRCFSCAASQQNAAKVATSQNANAKTWRCSACLRHLSRENFSNRQLRKNERTCHECSSPEQSNWTCSKCHQSLGRDSFNRTQRSLETKTCRNCLSIQCAKCERYLAPEFFSNQRCVDRKKFATVV